MDSADFKGFMGIRLNDTTFSNDIMLVIVLLLLSVFAWIFRSNTPLFGKMISNISAGEQRQSIFETTEKDSFLFNFFMTFQTLLLFSIFILSAADKSQSLLHKDMVATLLSLGYLFVFCFLYYLFKRGLYAIFGIIFIEQSTNKMMFTNFQALFCTWGIVLYLPVLWVLLFDTYLFLSIIFLIISFLTFKAILSLRFFYIFYNKNTGFLFFSLYLCAQEIAPLVFFYKGMVYTYNIIETNYSWQ